MSEAKKHLPPVYEARTQDGSGKWKSVGTVWKTAKKEVLSVTLTEPARSFILVPKKPVKSAQPA